MIQHLCQTKTKNPLKKGANVWSAVLLKINPFRTLAHPFTHLILTLHLTVQKILLTVYMLGMSGTYFIFQIVIEDIVLILTNFAGQNVFKSDQ